MGYDQLNSVGLSFFICKMGKMSARGITRIVTCKEVKVLLHSQYTSGCEDSDKEGGLFECLIAIEPKMKSKYCDWLWMVYVGLVLEI